MWSNLQSAFQVFLWWLRGVHTGVLAVGFSWVLKLHMVRPSVLHCVEITNLKNSFHFCIIIIYVSICCNILKYVQHLAVYCTRCFRKRLRVCSVDSYCGEPLHSPAGEACLYDASLRRAQRSAYFVNSMPCPKIFLSNTGCVCEDNGWKDRRMILWLDFVPNNDCSKMHRLRGMLT